LLINEHDLVREGILRILNGGASLQIVAGVSNIGEGLEIVRSTRVDVVLFDVDPGRMPKPLHESRIRPLTTRVEYTASSV
jgi:DNA-binding NarL/FixJ family response regulator